MKLYTFFRSSAAYRVRIALNYKALSYESVAVHLRRNGGEHKKEEYLAVNPQGLVPVLEHEGQALIQSPAILEYLEEKFPDPPLLPAEAVDRAHVRGMSMLIACEMHPLCNLRVLQYLRSDLGQSEEGVNSWYHHWIALGFKALEEMVDSSGPYCFGKKITMADVYLVPQYYNAQRFKCDLSNYPNLKRIVKTLNQVSAFAEAAPEVQADAE
ncbi:MAG: maleylacetoacetate isomerase [SAR324 cluster bacterium]|nr:maleylacetoacetate isomerase [SAR324 cluster bacterium]